MESDPIGLAGGLNTFLYSNANPVNENDPLGLWSTAAHNTLIRAFGKALGLSRSQVGYMQVGSAGADSLVSGYQGDAYSYMHAMTSSAWPDKQAACKRANQFVQEQMQQYESLLSQSLSVNSLTQRNFYVNKAYKALGMAMHTIMDNRSPAHTGFQFWDPSKASEHGPFPDSIEHVDSLTPALIQDVVGDMIRAMNGKQINCDCAAN